MKFPAEINRLKIDCRSMSVLVFVFRISPSRFSLFSFSFFGERSSGFIVWLTCRDKRHVNKKRNSRAGPIAARVFPNNNRFVEMIDFFRKWQEMCRVVRSYDIIASFICCVAYFSNADNAFVCRLRRTGIKVVKMNKKELCSIVIAHRRALTLKYIRILTRQASSDINARGAFIDLLI